MSKKPAAAAAAPAAGHGAAGDAAAPKKKKGKLMLLAVPVVLILLLAGGWFSGVLPGLLGMGKVAKPPGPPSDVAAAAPRVPVFAELPVMVTNLNSTGKRPVFLKLTAKLELARPEDQAAVATDMPRLLDIFQTYLRETRPEELQGAAGTWRLRQELIARANIALTPARVIDVLFTEMIVQ
jgi:flagellar FliL protein